MKEENKSCSVTGSELKTSGFYYTLSIIGGKYKMTILYLLAEHKVLRHNQIHDHLETVSFKTLSMMLKELVADGIVLRKEYPQIPPKVEYRLSQRGETLIPVLNTLCDWGEEHKNEIS